MKRLTHFLQTLALSTCLLTSSVYATQHTTPTPIQFNESGWNKYKEAIFKASDATGVSPTDLATFTSIESGFHAQAKNRTKRSTAGGLTGFTKTTWKTMVKSYSKKYGLHQNVSRFDAYPTALLTAEYYKENKAILSKALKRNVGTNEVYLAHFLGPQTAIGVLKAKANRPITAYVKATRGNERLLYRKGHPLTVGQFKTNIAKMIQSHRDVYLYVTLNRDALPDVTRNLAMNSLVRTLLRTAN